MKTQNEQWKAIADSNGEYHISDHGRVKSYKSGKELVLKPGSSGNGYPAVFIHVFDKKPKFEKIHKLVALAFIPNLENKPQVNHKDGNKLNNHIDNLEWSTRKENVNHAWKTGLFESKRLAISKAASKSNSKPVVDVVTNKKYDSLKLACESIGEPYGRHVLRNFKSSKLQRFYYL
jgi:hypothetical protein